MEKTTYFQKRQFLGGRNGIYHGREKENQSGIREAVPEGKQISEDENSYFKKQKSSPKCTSSSRRTVSAGHSKRACPGSSPAVKLRLLM
jgi:hypothetical protein